LLLIERITKHSEMKKTLIIGILLGSVACYSQGIKGLINKDSLNKKTAVLKKGNNKLSNEEVVNGLKEALSVGTSKASEKAGKTDGFYTNPRIYIPWPEEAIEMKQKLIKLGYSNKVEEFEMSLNRAGEEAALKAVAVFTNAIVNMSVQDGFAILKGTDTAATNYLRKTTYVPLKSEFLPVVREAVEKVKVTSYWNPLVSVYNRVPGVKKQNPDLDEYVTNKAINGLMLLIADEEMNIRKNPGARGSALLKKVFGN
jgi:hypothetical protein